MGKELVCFHIIRMKEGMYRECSLNRIEQLFAILYNGFMRGDMYVQR